MSRQLAQYPRFTVIPAAGTWLGSADAGLLFGDVGGPPGPRPSCRATAMRNGKPIKIPIRPPFNRSAYCGQPLKSLVDAGLYLGPPGELTASSPNPAIYLDPTYSKELQRRNTIGSSVDLNRWRQEHPEANANWWTALQCTKAIRGDQ